MTYDREWILAEDKRQEQEYLRWEVMLNTEDRRPNKGYCCIATNNWSQQVYTEEKYNL